MMETGDWSEQDLAEFMECVRAELGIKMPGNKSLMLQSRILRRLRQLNLESLDEYRQRLFHSADSEEERIHFLDIATTNHTSFFREPQHLEVLKQLAMEARGRFRVWCAGCSSGEEAYSIAMVLAEIQLTHARLDFTILATDVSTAMLEHGAAGIYDQERVAGVPLDLRRRYLSRSRNATQALVRVVPELRATVRFHHLNFMDLDYGIPERMDVIFFRNVMIYFDKPTQEAVVNRLCRYLKPGGFFFTGHSESLAGLDVPVELIAPAAYRRRE